MYSYPYPNVSATATVFAFYNGMLVVGTRADDSDAFPGFKCAPGGFLNARYVTDIEVVFEGETLEQAALREFWEECNIELNGDQLILFHEHSGPKTDPRAHVVNACYIVNLTLEQVERLAPGDDLKALDLVPFDKINNLYGPWAFNHLELALLAIHVWQNGGDYFQSKGKWAA